MNKWYWGYRQQFPVYYIVRYCTLLYVIVRYCTLLYVIVRYCTLLYVIVRYCTIKNLFFGLNTEINIIKGCGCVRRVTHRHAPRLDPSRSRPINARRFRFIFADQRRLRSKSCVVQYPLHGGHLRDVDTDDEI